MAKAPVVAMIKLQYFRSKICTPTKHKLVIKGLGFTRLNQIVEREIRRLSAEWWRRCHIWSASSIKCRLLVARCCLQIKG